MTSSVSHRDSDLAAWRVRASDRAALAEIVRRRKVCDATGQPLDTAGTVAMTVTVAPGVSKLAVVTAAHWDAAQGALSSADPKVDPDVLDGRLLFTGDARQSDHHGPASRTAVGKPPLSRPRGPVQRPHPPAPARSGPAPRLP